MKSLFIKKFKLLIGLIIISFISLAQSPESMNYQAVIRNSSGTIIANQSIGIRIKILQGSANGSTVYNETFTPTSNAYGMVSLQIGTGSVVSGSFSSIDWGNNSYFVETAADVLGGSNYSVISTTQFMSVPYALYAKSAGSSPSDNDWTETGSNIYRSTGNVGIGTTNPSYKLEVNGVIKGSQIEINGNQLKNTVSDLQIQLDGGKNTIMNGTSGNVGIGTTTPSFKLDVNGTARFNSQFDIYGTTRVTHFNWGANGDAYIRSGEDAGKIILQDIGGNVGIGTVSPTSKLDVNGDINLTGDLKINGLAQTFGGSSGLEQITENGNNGFRLTGSDPNNFGDIGANSTDLSTQTQASTTRGATGLYSLASGENTTASSYRSTAMGNNTIASNENTTAMGINTNASGNTSTAMGNSTTASGTNSTAMGSNNTASGTSSTAMGRGTIASGSYSTSLGELSTASGSRSLAAGQHASATAANSIAIGHAAIASGYGSIALGGEGNESAGLYSTAMGRYTKAHSVGELTIGSFNTNYNPVGGASTWDALDRLFVIGNGTSQNSRSNAFLVLKNGNTTINGQLTLTDGSSSIKFPNSDGSNGQVLQTNGSGTLSWSSISSGVSSLNDLSDAKKLSNSMFVGTVSSALSEADQKWNTAAGVRTLESLTTGNANTAFGYWALGKTTTSNSNTAFGSEALRENTTGGSNTAVGNYSMTSNSTGTYNTAIGDHALSSNTTGFSNTANGRNALYANTTGSRNTAIGFEAMKNSTTAGENTAVGYMSMFNNTGSYNVSLGQNTLTLSSGSRNVAIGYSSLWQNSSGSDNLSIGYQSGHENTSGSNNVALGKHSLYSLNSGSYNTGVGSHTNTSSASSVNQTVIGSFATGVADNSVTLGNSNVTAVYMAQNANATVYAGGLYVSGDINTGNIIANNISANDIFANSVTTSSDKRFKKDIKPIASSLDNVLKLRGVSYNFKVEEYSNKKFPADTQIGFIAQELLEIYPQLISKDKEGYYSVDYSKISPILVEAIKEQQKKIDKLETELGLIKNYLNIKEE